ncbi:MAG TPA: hypothetical protein VH277_04980, partial [Gemmatimonadaceae bacterium]|nr:hypothetical protein [Gemmatimonadaceae bacterium]
MRRIHSLVVAALLPAALAAQQTSSDRSPNNVRASFSYFAAHYGSLLVAALESIPAAKYAYRPTPVQQTVG